MLERADECLRRALYRPCDTAIRYGYNEFVIMLPETMLSGSTIVEQHVLQQVDNLGLMGVGQLTDNTVYIFLYANLRYHQKHTVTKRVTPLIAPLLNCVNKS